MSIKTSKNDTIVVAADAGGMARAEAQLRAGQVAAIPTETVYGLAADATNSEAVARIYEAKGRPSFNPLIAHVSGRDMAETLVDASPLARDLMAHFWPGPLTLVLPLRKDAGIAGLVSAGLSTLAVRAPDHPVPQALIKALGRPLAAPSANRSGFLSATRADHVLRSLSGRIPLVLDGGQCSAGLESTIIAVHEDRLRLLRPGAIALAELEAVAPVDLPSAAKKEAGTIEAPGMLSSHYAPEKPLRLNAAQAQHGEYLVGFGAVKGQATLSASGDLVEAAAKLFDLLHSADESEAAAIAVAPIPEEGLGQAINDRLRRAATPIPTHTPDAR